MERNKIFTVRQQNAGGAGEGARGGAQHIICAPDTAPKTLARQALLSRFSDNPTTGRAPGSPFLGAELLPPIHSAGPHRPLAPRSRGRGRAGAVLGGPGQRLGAEWQAAGPGGGGAGRARPAGVPAGSRAGLGGCRPASPSPPSPAPAAGRVPGPDQLTPVPLSHTTTFLPSVSIPAPPPAPTPTPTRPLPPPSASAGPPRPRARPAARRARTPEAVRARHRPISAATPPPFPLRLVSPRCHGGGPAAAQASQAGALPGRKAARKPFILSFRLSTDGQTAAQERVHGAPGAAVARIRAGAASPPPEDSRPQPRDEGLPARSPHTWFTCRLSWHRAKLGTL